jgi:hypothetical protein
VASLEVLRTPPCRIQSIVEVVGATHHYILTRMPLFLAHFLVLTAFLLSKTTRQTFVLPMILLA